MRLKSQIICLAVVVVLLEGAYLQYQSNVLAQMDTRINSEPVTVNPSLRSADSNKETTEDASRDTAESQPGAWLKVNARKRPDQPLTRNWTRGHRSEYLKSSEFAEMQSAIQRRALMLKYGSLYAKLGLSAQKIENVTKILVNRENLPIDASQAVHAGSGPTGKSDLIADVKLMTELTASGQQDLDAALKLELGREGYETYRDYQAHLAQYATINALQASLASDPGNLLNATQLDELASILKRDPEGARRLIAPVSDDRTAYADVSGVRFDLVEPNEVKNLEDYHLTSGYVPSEAISAQLQSSHLMTEVQLAAFTKLLTERRADQALAGEFWQTPNKK